jgi:sarcosine oxidase gamma subunit
VLLAGVVEVDISSLYVFISSSGEGVEQVLVESSAQGDFAVPFSLA